LFYKQVTVSHTAYFKYIQCFHPFPRGECIVSVTIFGVKVNPF
jgi:hypothetical protein